MSMLDRIRDSFKYLDKNGLKHLIEKIKLHDVHWTGTHAEYEAVKDTLPDYTILHFTDDYEDNLGMPIKNISSAAGTNTWNFAQFVSEMLMDIAPQNWENGSYAGKFTSTHSGQGFFGSWQGSYVMSKAFSGSWGSFMFGSANGLSFTATWSGTKWNVQVHGRSVNVSGTTDANGNIQVVYDGHSGFTYQTMRIRSIAVVSPNAIGLEHYNVPTGIVYVSAYSPDSTSTKLLNTAVNFSLIIDEYSN